MKIVAGGGKKRAKFWGGSGGGMSGGGMSGGGLSGGGLSGGEGCPAEGGSPEGGGSSGRVPSEMGCRVRGFGFSSGFLGTKTETEQKQNEERDE